MKPDATLTLLGRDVLLRVALLAEKKDTMKDLLGGFRKQGRHWILDASRASKTIKTLREAGVTLEADEAVLSKLKEIELATWLDLQAVEARLEEAERELASSGERLREYQRRGVRWLASRSVSALLGDGPGLGKTLQTLASVPVHSPLLVICPVKVKGEWARQVARFRPSLKCTVVSGREGFRFPTPDEIVVANYDILPDTHKARCLRVEEKKCPGCSPFYPGAHRPGCDRFRRVCPGCTDLPTPSNGTIIVFDELHYLKNPKALRTESGRALGQRVVEAGGKRIGLTGTPLMNHPGELWDVLDVIGLSHEAFGSWSGFKEAFGAKPKEVHSKDKRTGKIRRQIRGLEWGEPKPEASERLSRVMLRRLMKDVLQDLPEKTYKLIPVEVDRKQLKACDQLMAEVERMGGLDEMADLLGRKKLPFELISAARAALAAAKVPAMLDVVESYEEDETPLIVFSAHRAPIEVLADREGWKAILGSMAEAPKDVISWFQDESNLDVRGLGCTIGSAGTGLTLTRASHLLFVDQAWNPAQNDQAEARALRLGQKNAVLVNILVANHPLDERLAELLTEKKHLFTSVVDGAADRRMKE